MSRVSESAAAVLYPGKSEGEQSSATGQILSQQAVLEPVFKFCWFTPVDVFELLDLSPFCEN